MNIPELKSEKEKLEIEIHEALTKLIVDFENKTGVMIDDLNIRFEFAHETGNREPTYKVVNAEVIIKI